MFGSCYVVQYIMSFLFCNNLAGEEKANCFFFNNLTAFD